MSTTTDMPMGMSEDLETIVGKLREIQEIAGPLEVDVWSHIRLAGNEPTPDLWEIFRGLVKINGELHLAEAQAGCIKIFARRLEQPAEDAKLNDLREASKASIARLTKEEFGANGLTVIEDGAT